MKKQKIESNITEIKKNKEFQDDDWEFLADIESLINQPYKEKVKCVVFDIKITTLYQTEDCLFELGAIEIENLNYTNKTIHMNIKSENQIPIQIQNLKNANTSKNNLIHYKQDAKKQLKYFLDFVGDSYLITCDAVFNYNFLIKELDYWGLQRIDKKKIRCINKIYENLFKPQKTYKKEDIFFCEYYKNFKTYDPLYDCLFGITIITQIFFQLYKKCINEIMNHEIIKKIKVNLNKNFCVNIILNEKDNDSSNESREKNNEILERVNKKFDIKQEIINCNNDLNKINADVYWYFHRFFKKEPSQLEKEINSLSDLKDKLHNIGKNIDFVYDYCSESEKFRFNFKKHQKYIDEVLKSKYEIQKIKVKIEIIKKINTGIREYYIDFIDANYPYFV